MLREARQVDPSNCGKFRAARLQCGGEYWQIFVDKARRRLSRKFGCSPGIFHLNHVPAQLGMWVTSSELTDTTPEIKLSRNGYHENCGL